MSRLSKAGFGTGGLLLLAMFVETGGMPFHDRLRNLEKPASSEGYPLS